VGEGIEPLTVAQLARRLARTGGPVTGRATVNARNVGPAFAATVIDVEVDPDTGKVKVLRCTIAQDAGRAIHPSYVEGQMQGGTAQGIGWALNEEYVYDLDGRLRNFGLLDYRMPTCLDLPMIETVIVEVAAHPLHSRRRGGLDRASSGCRCECDLRRNRCSDDGVADVTATIAQGNSSETTKGN
jgi:CO/xanthine dehydrogenase Mo-binding subunit